MPDKERQSLADKLGWPDALRVALVLSCLALAASPYLGGKSLGSLVVPQLPATLQDVAVYVGPILLLLSLAIILPLLSSSSDVLTIRLDNTYSGGLRTPSSPSKVQAHVLAFLESRWWVTTPQGDSERVTEVHYELSSPKGSGDADFMFINEHGESVDATQFTGTARVHVVAGFFTNAPDDLDKVTGHLTFLNGRGLEYRSPNLCFRRGRVDLAE